MEVRNFTKKRFNHESKRNKVNRKSQRLLKRNKDVQVALNELAENTAKTHNFNDLCQAFRVRIDNYDLIYNCFANKQFMKLKAEARMAEQRTMDNLVNWISYGKTKAVGIGDCSRTHNFKGRSPSGPSKKIRRYFVKKGVNTTLVNEAYTSKRSCCCRGEDLKPVKGKKKIKDKERKNDDLDSAIEYKTVAIHGLRFCPRCGKTWDRDFSAAINIFDVFYNSMVRKGDRPWHLKKIVYSRPADHPDRFGTWFQTWGGFASPRLAR